MATHHCDRPLRHHVVPRSALARPWAAIGLAALAACAATDPTPDADSGAGAQLRLSWTLLVADEAVPCVDLGVATIATRVDVIAVVATEEATGEIFYDQFACAAFQGITGALPLGRYTVEVSALKANEVVSAALPRRVGVVASRGMVDLGEFAFAFPELTGAPR